MYMYFKRSTVMYMTDSVPGADYPQTADVLVRCSTPIIVYLHVLSPCRSAHQGTGVQTNHIPGKHIILSLSLGSCRKHAKILRDLRSENVLLLPTRQLRLHVHGDCGVQTSTRLTTQYILVHRTQQCHWNSHDNSCEQPGPWDRCTSLQ